jgi:hypothetical protein
MARGGKREGAGRPAGVQSAKTVARRELVQKAAAQGKSPLEVMLENMRHFQKLAESAESVITEFSADKIAGMEPAEQFKYLLAEVKKAAGLREMAQNCARDASPYVHHKLASVEHTGKDGGPIKTQEVTDEQRAKALNVMLARKHLNGNGAEADV